MSIARREPQWSSRSFSWAGHALFVQRQYASPWGRKATLWQAGHLVGNSQGTASGGRRDSITFTTYGMTSPARSIRTVSPTRMSLRRTSSSLWRLTLRMTTPASSTGSSCAPGVSTPVLPTLTVIARTTVVAWRAANLNAIAHRGWCAVAPSRRCCSSELTLTTAPSASYGRASRSASSRVQYSTTASRSGARAARGLVGSPLARRASSVSQCVETSASSPALTW